MVAGRHEQEGVIMHKPLWIGLLLGVIAYGASWAPVQSQPLPENSQKTARIALAQEFARELEVLYRLQETAKKEFAEDSSTSGRLEPISKSFEEDNEAGKLDKAKKIVGVVLPANEDPALPLNPGEEALNEPAPHVAA
jgi:hypothetical protein